MTSTPELVKAVMEERDREMRHDHLARAAACYRACCHPSLFDRLARALGVAPATC